jgi:bifunctional NMN adenylyltransferase/nudix hydrolase
MENKKKPFKLGILVGRFQVLHKGHSDMVRRAIELCERVALFVGSSQESGTLKNPLTYETRKSILLTAFADIEIYPLPDIGVGNNCAWGEYVLKNVIEKCGEYPDLFVSGKESRRTSWIDDDWNIAELYVPKSIDISATKMIQFVIEDNKEEFERYIEPSIKARYDDIRKAVIASQDKLDTQSI